MSQLQGKFIANGAVSYAKIQSESASTLLGNPTGSGAAPSEITLGAGLSFSGSTLVASGSAGEHAASTIITLSSEDITNQFVDLEHIAVFASATDNSVIMSVYGGPVQLPNVDYVADDGDLDDLTRITFLGALATGGASELVEGDILIFNYEYLNT